MSKKSVEYQRGKESRLRDKERVEFEHKSEKEILGKWCSEKDIFSPKENACPLNKWEEVDKIHFKKTKTII